MSKLSKMCQTCKKVSKPVVRVKVVVDNSAKASSRGLVTFGRRIVLGPT